MLVLGIDPGSTVTAYGVVRLQRGRYHHVGHGFVRTQASQAMGDRLMAIHAGVRAAIAEHCPDSVAIEAIFQHKSSESALRLGQARGVALLAAAQEGFDAVPYNPQTIKRTVGASGRADKDAIATMVCMLLGIDRPKPHDLTDALAIAITHCAHSRGRARSA